MGGGQILNFNANTIRPIHRILSTQPYFLFLLLVVPTTNIIRRAEIIPNHPLGTQPARIRIQQLIVIPTITIITKPRIPFHITYTIQPRRALLHKQLHLRLRVVGSGFADTRRDPEFRDPEGLASQVVHGLHVGLEVGEGVGRVVEVEGDEVDGAVFAGREEGGQPGLVGRVLVGYGGGAEADAAASERVDVGLIGGYGRGDVGAGAAGAGDAVVGLVEGEDGVGGEGGEGGVDVGEPGGCGARAGVEEHRDVV